MYFFRDKKLAEALKVDAVGQKEQMQYFLIVSLCFSLLMTTFMYEALYDSGANAYDYMIDVMSLLFTVIHILIAYRINEKGDGENFLSRYICLSLPVGVQTFLVAIILGVVAAIFDEADSSVVYEEEEIQTTMSLVIVTMLTYCYPVWRYITDFKIASGQS